MCESRTTRAFVSFGQCSEKMVFERAIPSSSTQNVLAQYLRRILTELLYGGISMTKFNNQELISNYPNWTCINPKLNGNKPILCSKSEMHQTEGRAKTRFRHTEW